VLSNTDVDENTVLMVVGDFNVDAHNYDGKKQVDIKDNFSKGVKLVMKTSRMNISISALV
jgi:hypothetical protein